MDKQTIVLLVLEVILLVMSVKMASEGKDWWEKVILFNAVGYYCTVMPLSFFMINEANDYDHPTLTYFSSLLITYLAQMGTCKIVTDNQNQSIKKAQINNNLYRTEYEDNN